MTTAAVIAAVSLGLIAPAASALPGKSSPETPAARNVQAMCGAAPAGMARCFALRRVDIPSHLGATPLITPSGYGPANLASAYSLPANGGAGQTVAIVDAFDDPNAEADLATYRSQFGLPACTTANGCFRKIDQRGSTSYPPSDTGWAAEISLDIDMVSAVAPQAHILLVEADAASFDNLGAAVDEAVSQGAKYVSNSYGSGYDSTPGSGEDPHEVTDLDPHYNHPGVAIVASSGENAFGVSYPAASQYVTSVGGTSLVPNGSARGWSESVWHSAYDGPGSGCSLYEAKPSWQADSGCSNRTVADVSAVADPATGVAVYDTFSSAGWQVFGGTSASSPIIAGVYADAGTPVAGSYPSSYPYADPGGLNDVTTGNNGSCSPAYFCTAETGYDGPTGLGTPNGVSAFVGPVDDTAPTDAPVVTGTLGSGGWYTSDVSVAWNWTDEVGGSGIDPGDCTPTSGSGGTQGSAVVVSSSCQDLAGNPASDSKTFKIDTVGPTIVCAVATRGPVFRLGAANQHVRARASDAPSGLVGNISLATAAHTFSPGAKTAAFSASDKAGNTTNTSCPYVIGYRFGGFTSPPPKKTVKSGSTLVLKFQLQNAAGKPISNSAAQSLISPSCKITIIVVKGGPVSGCPTYSSSTKQFHFNLKTTNAMKGANGVSITVTIGSTVVTRSGVDPFTVK